MTEVASIDENASVEDCLDNQAIDHFITRKLQIVERHFVGSLVERGRAPSQLYLYRLTKDSSRVSLHLLYRVVAIVLLPAEKKSS